MLLSRELQTPWGALAPGPGPCGLIHTQFSSVQSLSRVQLFVTPRTAAGQASLSITNTQGLLTLMSIESVMPSSHLILCHPLFLLPSMFPSIRVFSSESALRIRWPKHWSCSFSIRLISSTAGVSHLLACKPPASLSPAGSGSGRSAGSLLAQATRISPLSEYRLSAHSRSALGPISSPCCLLPPQSLTLSFQPQVTVKPTAPVALEGHATTPPHSTPIPVYFSS